MQRVLTLVLVSTLAAHLPEAGGQITTFNAEALAPGDPADDLAAQVAYLDAVAAGGYPTFFEGFIGGAWDLARSSIVDGPHVASSIISQGITWHSSDGDFITTSDSSYGVTPWNLYSKGGTPQELHAVPATIIGQSSKTLYGLGVWVSGGPPGKGKLHVILDDVVDLKFERVIGYEVNPPDPPEPVKETIRLTSGKQFFGVVAPQGFTKFQLLEVEGALEDQVLMWAADFTFAGESEPSTLASIANGDWNQVTTWDDGALIPSVDYRARVDGHTVMMNTSSQALSFSIRADGLVVVPPDRTLTIVDALLLESGELELASRGTAFVGSNVVINPAAGLGIGLAGTGSGQLNANGDVFLAGDLDFRLSGSSPFQAGTHVLMNYDTRKRNFDSVTDLNAYVTGDGLTYGDHELLLTINHDLLIGDLDLDGDVDFFDYIATSNNFGETDGKGFQDGDMDGDGDVDFFDYIAVSNHFGDALPVGAQAAHAASVPEPGTLLLLAMGLAVLGLCTASRRRASYSSSRNSRSVS